MFVGFFFDHFKSCIYSAFCPVCTPRLYEHGLLAGPHLRPMLVPEGECNEKTSVAMEALSKSDLRKPCETKKVSLFFIVLYQVMTFSK